MRRLAALAAARAAAITASRGVALAVLVAVAAPASTWALAAVPAPRRQQRRAENRSTSATASATTSGSVLDELPRPAPKDWRAEMLRLRARGPREAASAAWVAIFYGDAAARAAARREVTLALRRDPADRLAVFDEMVLDKIEGQQRGEMRAALRLLRLAPDDPASELAARELSGGLDAQGRELLDAAPELRQLLAAPRRDPATVYMLGRPLLALVDAPGVTLPLAEAIQLSGRPQWWTLFGPFGRWRNLDFDQTFPVETKVADQYQNDGRVLPGRPFDATRGIVDFPADWRDQGIDYAVTFLNVPRAQAYDLRVYSAASFEVMVNGKTLLRNDRRSRYAPAAAVAAFLLRPGWNRVVVKLGGAADREFTLSLRPRAMRASLGGSAAPAATNAAQPPAGARLAGPPVPLPAPPTLATWAAARLRAHPDDAAALWADAVRRLEDEDAEDARVELETAAKLVPNSTPVWLALTDAYPSLNDASQTWASAQTDAAAQKAEKTDPRALPAADRRGQVLISEGKLTEAGAEFAKCAGRGYAACDWDEFHLDARRHWTPEAAAALAHALADSPSDWSALGDALDFYTSVGMSRDADPLEAALRRDPRAREVLARFLLGHGRPEQAAPLFAAAIQTDPSSAPLRRDYIRALLRSGKIAAAAAQGERAVRDLPDDARLAGQSAAAALAANPAQGLAALRAAQFGRNALRHDADFLADDKFWTPWYKSAAAVIKDAPGKDEYPNAASVLVLDQMVDRINPDSTRDSYIHQIFRVLNSAGIEEHGTVRIPAGSDLITLRTIKKDGTILLPEIRANLDSVQMPGLEPGDFVETEYVMHEPASRLIPGTIDNNMFFVFNSSREPYNYSNYVVLSPNDYPLMVDTERFPSPPTVTKLSGAFSGWTAREWLVQKTRILGVEPEMPPEPELVPKAWVSSQLTWDEISDYLADASFSVRRVTAEMRAEAATLAAAGGGAARPEAAANQIFNWVAANIQPAEAPPLSPARQFFVDHSGSRLATFLALLSAAKVPWQLVMARPVTDHSKLNIPNFASFQYPLVRVDPGRDKDAPKSPAWYDLNNNFARVGYINPAFRGGDALIAEDAPADGAADAVFTRVPAGISPLDGIATTAQIHVNDNGDAVIHLSLEFRGPLGEELRRNLGALPASRLSQIYQGVLLRSYPNATADRGQVEGLNHSDGPLTVSVDGAISGFAQKEDGAWEIDHLVAPLNLLSRYASLPSRIHPLVIPADSLETTAVQVTLPTEFGAPRTPGDQNVTGPFGSYRADYTAKPGELDLTRTVELNANYITPAQYGAFRQFGEAVDGRERLPITGTLPAAAK